MKQHWNPTLYNDKHAFVYNYGEGVLDLLAPQPHERILDLGCGSGQLTAQINNLAKEVVGIDKSPEMIADAQAKFEHVDFQVADAANFHFDKKFDAIFSNATLHWVSDYKKAIACMYESLLPGGRIVAEFGGKNNVGLVLKALRTCLNKRGFYDNAKVNFWYFPSVGEYTTALEKGNFRVTYAEHYDRPTALQGTEGIKDWFRMFGHAFFKNIPALIKEEILQETQEVLKKTLLQDGIWYADYKRIRVMAVKQGNNDI